MKKTVLQYLLMLLVASGCSLTPGVSQLKDPSDLRKLDNAIEVFMHKWHLEGGSVALVKNNKLVYSKAFGYDLDHSRLHPGSLLKIASLSKPLTAIAVMKLVEEGRISLDSRVFGNHGILNRYTDIRDERIYHITVRHLLNHTAGWDREVSPEADPMFNPFRISAVMGKEGPADASATISYMLTKRLDFNPGERFAYSNLGYSILGRIIEQVSGMAYQAYVQESVLHPLGIYRMTLAGNEEYPDNNPATGFINIAAMDSHGGWKASSDELAKILSALGTDSQYHLLKDESLSLMKKCFDGSPKYGLGWFVNDKGNMWHTGSLKNCSAFMARLSSGLCAVVIFNTRPADPSYFNELDQVVWDGIRGVNDWPSEDLFKHEVTVQ